MASRTVAAKDRLPVTLSQKLILLTLGRIRDSTQVNAEGEGMNPIRGIHGQAFVEAAAFSTEVRADDEALFLSAFDPPRQCGADDGSAATRWFDPMDCNRRICRVSHPEDDNCVGCAKLGCGFLSETVPNQRGRKITCQGDKNYESG